MKIFKCIEYRIDFAKGSGEIPIKVKVYIFLKKKNKFIMHRLDLTKLEHFFDFIFSSGMLQDLAVSVTKIKHDSGEEQKVAHAILTTKFSHTIAFYIESCKIVDSDFCMPFNLHKVSHLQDLMI